MRRHLVAAFKPHMDGMETLFGSLEASIMEQCWAHDELSARDVFEDLRNHGHRISYGAVRTVLDRLVRKGMLARTMVGNQYLYRATRSREEFASSAVGEILDSLLSSFGEPVLAQFLNRLEAADPEHHERLAQIINEAEAKRRGSPSSAEERTDS